MNTKLKKAILAAIGCLAIVTLAIAQTAFKADGIIESTQGGFKFPDESIQTTAHDSSPEVYNAWDNCDIDPLRDKFGCFFDVPDGKILVIEHIGGYHAGSDQHVAYMSFQGFGSTFFIPTVSDIIDGTGYIFEARRIGYAVNSNAHSDSDFVISGYKFAGATNFDSANCYVTGRLYDAPQE